MLMPLDMLRFHIWKLITGPFAHGQLLQLLFSLISYVPSAVYEEGDMGTVPFTLRFFKLSVFINVMFCALAFVVGFTIMPAAVRSPCMGLWPILFCDLVIQCYKDPEMPRGLCCLPIQIKSKWYPLVLYGIFTLLFMNVDLSFTTGLGVGYLYAFGYLRCLETSAATVSAWEKRWPFVRYKDDPSFRPTNAAAAAATATTQASTGSSGGVTSFFGGGSQSGTATEAPGGGAARPAAAAQPSSFSAFSGKGVSLGSDTESTKSSSSMLSNFLGSGSKSGSSAAPTAQESQAPRNTASAPAQAREDKREGDPEAPTEANLSIDDEENEAPFLQKKADDAKGSYQQVENDN